MTSEDLTVLRALPKVLLHDHLDGGLRPATIVELAGEAGHELPTTDPVALARWFVEAADSGSLERYLETFAHTTAVMQTPANLRRVAREAVEDLAADGVVYAELRYAPEQHQENGLELQQIVDAVEQGFDEGVQAAQAAGNTIRVGTILCGMRQGERVGEIAALALGNKDRGVVGFDIAGPEAGFAPEQHLAAFRTLQAGLLPYTIHAGEGAGRESIYEALASCGAWRLGHGVRITEDLTWVDESTAELGELASWIRDRQVVLEVAPSSNLQTGIAASIGEHPITALRDLGFAVTINTDNRLVSGTSMTREFALLAAEAGWTIEDFEAATLTAITNSFATLDDVDQIVNEQILPGYTAAQTP